MDKKAENWRAKKKRKQEEEQSRLHQPLDPPQQSVRTLPEGRTLAGTVGSLSSGVLPSNTLPATGMPALEPVLFSNQVISSESTVRAAQELPNPITSAATVPRQKDIHSACEAQTPAPESASQLMDVDMEGMSFYSGNTSADQPSASSKFSLTSSSSQHWELPNQGLQSRLSDSSEVFESTHVRNATGPLGGNLHSHNFPVRELERNDWSSKSACQDHHDPSGDFSAEPSPNQAFQENEPLYEGARLTVKESLLSILTYAVAENLSFSSLGRLLSLIDLHCPAKSQSLKTVHQLLKPMETCETKVTLSFYCSHCWKERLSRNDLCDTCTDPMRKVHYFAPTPMIPQISKLYRRPDFLSAIKHKYNGTKKVANNYEDLYDGDVYKEAESEILGNSNNISLTYHCDGVQLYESSHYSLWVLYFVVNELSPDERYKPENIIIGGIWGSHEKPHPNLFMKHTADELYSLRDGVQIEINGSKVTVIVILLCGTCDSPAKAVFLNIKTHSGYFSCPYCLIKGEKSKRTNDVLVFPYEEVIRERSQDSYKAQVAASICNYNSDAARDEVCKGVWGPTLLSSVLFSDMFFSAAIDSMHCVFLGVTKQILNLLFGETYKNELFSLHEYASTVNERLSSLGLPDFVDRLPVSVLKLVLWKASLCRNFFFYIFLPVLKDIMDTEYFNNFLLLIDAISLLNSSSISDADITLADLKLAEFLNGFQRLYGLRHMSFNLHLLRHAAKMVRRLGPFHFMSCFMFEDLNGKIARLAQGTKDAPLQIAKRMCMLTDMTVNVEKLPAGQAKSFCEKMTKKWKRLHIQEIIAPNVFVVGFFDKEIKFKAEVLELLPALQLESMSFVTFPKLYMSKQLYVASSYVRSARVSSHVQYVCGDETVFGEILTFVKIVNTPQTFAYIRRLDVERFHPDCVRYMYKYVGGNTYDFVPVKSLLTVCFKIAVADAVYICVPLNDLEKE